MKATKADREQVVQIIYQSLANIPSANWVAGSSKNKNKRFRAFAEYMFDVSIGKNGVYLSSCKKGVLLMFHSQAEVGKLKMLYYQLKVINKFIGYSRLVSIFKREKYIKTIRSLENDYLYVWFFAVEPSMRGKGAGIELKNIIFEESKHSGLPVFVETTIEQNKKVYERYGFAPYHNWVSEKFNFITWFMKLNPVK